MANPLNPSRWLDLIARDGRSTPDLSAAIRRWAELAAAVHRADAANALAGGGTTGGETISATAGGGAQR